jgi:hypothetical protein
MFLGDTSSEPTPSGVRLAAPIFMDAVAIWPMHFIGNRAIQMVNGQAEYQIQYRPGHTAGSFFPKGRADVHTRASWELPTYLNHSIEVVKRSSTSSRGTPLGVSSLMGFKQRLHLEHFLFRPILKPPRLFSSISVP